MVLFVWLVGMALALFDIARSRQSVSGRWLGRGALLFSAISLGIFLVFGLIHAANIARDARVQQPGSGITLEQLAAMSAGHIVTYYVVILLLMSRAGRRHSGGTGRAAANRCAMALAGWGRAAGWPRLQPWCCPSWRCSSSSTSTPAWCGPTSSTSRARPTTRPTATTRRSSSTRWRLEEQPREDYYYLFLGRAQLERARQSTGSEREQYLADGRTLIAARARAEPDEHRPQR